jgi:hypothetical protein
LGSPSTVVGRISSVMGLTGGDDRQANLDWTCGERRS